MIARPTVFVLGAGASMPYNFPSGPELVRRIVKNLHFDKDKLQNNSASIRRNTEIQKIIKEGQSLEFIWEFVNSLWHSNTSSLDEFIYRRNEFRTIAKLAIAQEMMRYEDESRLISNKDLEISKLSDNAKQRWYPYLWRLLIDGAAFEEFGNNKVSFITFNYDRSLEQFLYLSLLNLYGKDSVTTAQQLNRIPIIHPYGKLGRLEWETNPIGVINSYSAAFGPERSLGEIADNLSAIYDADAGLQTKEEIEKIVAGAGRLHFLGFGYHRMNLEVLGLDKFTKSVISGTAYGLTQTEQDRAKSRFGLNKEVSLILKEKTCLDYLRGEPLC